jgi:anti-sigma regulatory factor (Ser/Thr protein kinase)
VTLTVELRKDDIRLSVRDAGRWRPPHLRFERGRGFRILRAVMQDVVVTRRGDGTEVRMRRELHGATPVR